MNKISLLYISPCGKINTDFASSTLKMQSEDEIKGEENKMKLIIW